MTVTKEYIGQLVDKYGDTVLRVSYTYLNNMADAEDVVQDVFLQVIDKKNDFNDENHEKAWLIRTAINMCKNRKKRFWDRNRCSIDEIAEPECYDRYNLDTDVMKAVMSLPEKYRTVVYMFYYEGWKTAEIARITGQEQTTVRSLLHRARARLKELLKEDYDFE